MERENNSAISISVMMPVFNAGSYLDESIRSILNQSYEKFELIIVDDASTDNSLEIIRKYADLDARIKWSSNPINLGIAANRNACVKNATGKYLAWQDADDISLPNRLEHQIHFMELNLDVGIIGGSLEIFSRSNIRGVRSYPLNDSAIRRKIFRYSPIAQPSVMLRREAIEAAGEYSLIYPPAEDLDMTFRIGQHYKLANLSEILVRYRESDSSATSTAMKRMEINTVAIRLKYFRSQGFRGDLIDAVFNTALFFSIWLVPQSFERWLFAKWRNNSPQ